MRSKGSVAPRLLTSPWLKVTLQRSLIKRAPKQRKVAEHMGLQTRSKSVIVPNDAPSRGRINVIAHLVSVDEHHEAPPQGFVKRARQVATDERMQRAAWREEAMELLAKQNNNQA